MSPGHVFPLRARKGGVLVRTGQTEGSVDLARLAGLKPADVICEIMREDGEMARRPELEEFATKHGLMLLSVADMIAYRLQREQIVRCEGTGSMRPGSLGPGDPFTAHYYASEVEDTEYLALVRGDVAGVSAAGGHGARARRRDGSRSPIHSICAPISIARSRRSTTPASACCCTSSIAAG